MNFLSYRKTFDIDTILFQIIKTFKYGCLSFGFEGIYMLNCYKIVKIWLIGYQLLIVNAPVIDKVGE